MITYMTLPGDTLEKIASDLKVENPVYIKEFHNKHCAVYDRLTEPVKLRTGSVLFIPFGDEIGILNRAINEKDDSLYYHPPHGKINCKTPLFSGTYAIKHRKYQDSQLQSSYSYKTELKYLRAEQDDHFFSFKIFGSAKDGMESDTKAANLAKACAAILFPVEIKIDKTGKLTDASLYHSETFIQNQLDSLKKYFTDPLSSSYIDQLKKNTEDENHVLKSLRRTLPVHFLFGSFYRAKYKEWTDSEVYHESIPWLSNASPIRFELYNRILPKEQAFDEALKIVQSGNSCDNRNLNQIYNKEYEYQETTPTSTHSLRCSHEAQYIFDRADMMIQKITGNFELQIGDTREKDIFMMEKQ
ncbi:hypothetical protein [Chryseobacterium pennipullorum]|uniref:LysM domain-containing protein n=1 Tax=Chryseobacterium pennipullorum TaxID=2258963 RepID=A0A3D9B5V0_9FLAO|nr:hypothetical protein [Chryseobacterium pennipullorum]REC48582.1 hypothetical protein DRF67_07115 [Chryseobacterium pennipullorum]